jgi:long-chain acyl-CoA synthetase
VSDPVFGIWNIARATPDADCLVEPDGTAFTAGDAVARAHRAANGLRALGLQRGDKVAVLLPNAVEYLDLLLATSESGMHLVPINWHLSAPEIAYIVDDSEAKVLIGHARFADALGKVAAEVNVPDGRRFIVDGDLEGFGDYAAWLDAQSPEEPAERPAGDIMPYTSGTTGRPKGVERPLMDIDADTRAAGGSFLCHLFGMATPDHVHLVVAPLYHTAVTNFALASLQTGHRIVLMDKWTPEECLRLIQDYRVTTSHMVPTMFHRMLRLPQDVRDSYDVSSVSHMIHSAAPCPIPTKHAMLEWWGPAVWEYYAASEGGGTIASPEDWLAHPGTVGKPWPISEVVILDDDGNQLPAGQVGTIWMRMGQHRFTYHGDAEKTKRSWNEEGFFTVGDVGEMDEDGFLFLRDRKVDMIIAGGVNIYPAEVESALMQHPKVLDCAVFGIPDDDMGEQVKAAVQIAEDATPGPELEQELLAFLSEQLGSYKVPRSIDFHVEFPRTETGKLVKRVLRDPYWEGRDSALV